MTTPHSPLNNVVNIHDPLSPVLPRVPLSRSLSATNEGNLSPATIEPPQSLILNDINSYLEAPLVELRGKTVLQYWNEERSRQPDLAEMALTYCSGPATSVDDERSFSEGRNQCAWNQRSMTSQTFREKMSVGSWAGAPFFKQDVAAEIIEENTRALRGPAA